MKLIADMRISRSESTADAITAIEPLNIATISLMTARVSAPQIEKIAARNLGLVVLKIKSFQFCSEQLQQILFQVVKPSAVIA